MDVNVKVTIDLGDKTMSLFGGLAAANDTLTRAADTAGRALKQYAGESAEDKEPEVERHVRNTESRRDRDDDRRDDDRESYGVSDLKDMSPTELTKILKKEFDVNPDDFEGKNTNKKLRDLILAAQSGELDAEPEPKADADDDARDERSSGVTHDDIRDLMAEVIDADEDNRPKVLKQLSKIGAKSVGTIKDEDVADFFGFLQSLKDA